MSNEINNRMYAFLAQYNKGGESWAKFADKEVGNGDEILSKNEFTKFVNQFSSEFNKEDIDTFWSSSLDTNKNGYLSKARGIKNLGNLDKDELKNIDGNLEIYVKLEEFIDKNVKGKAPNVLLSTRSKWETDVANKLRNLVASSMSAGKINNVDKFLNDAFKIYSNECTAECCVKEYSDNLNNSGVLRSYNYDLSQDSVLAEHIITYCANLDANSATPQSIKDDIKNIVDSYLKTAKLTEEGNYNGFDSQTGLNPLQIAVVTKKITNELQGLASKYSEYADYFNEAVTTFVNGKVSGASNFEEISSDAKIKEFASEFQNSGLLQKLDTAISVKEKYQNKIDEAFKQELSGVVGETVAQMILDNLDGEYANIINNVVQDILNDKIKNLDGAKAEILKQVKANFANFLPEDLENYDLDDLSNINEGAAKASSSLRTVDKDSSSALSVMKNSAIKLCDGIVRKGGEYAQLVYESKFGRNYTETINNMSSIDSIKSILSEIIKKGKDLELVQSITATITGGPNSGNSIVTNGSAKYTLNTTFQKDGVQQDIDASDVSYSLKTLSNSSIGNVTVDDFGNLSIQGGTQGGYLKFTVQALVNGVAIEPAQTFTITVKKAEETIQNASWIGTDRTNLPGKNKDFSDGDGGLRIWGGDGRYNDQNLNSANISISALYSGNYNIELGTSAHSDGNKYASDICDRLYNLGYAVVNALSAQGLNKDKLTTAMKNVTAYWSENINDVGNVSNKGCNKGSQRGKSDSTYNKLSNGFTNGKYHGITRGKDTKGNDQKVYMINFKEYVDAILAEYSAIV